MPSNREHHSEGLNQRSVISGSWDSLYRTRRTLHWGAIGSHGESGIKAAKTCGSDGSNKKSQSNNNSQYFNFLFYIVCTVAQSYRTLCDPVAHQVPLSMGLFTQKYWSRLPFSYSRGIFPTPGLNLHLLHW